MDTKKPTHVTAVICSTCPSCGDHVDLSQFLDTETLTKELKSRGLGVFNLSLPFHYIPKNEDSEAGSD